jgi:hypothetical protein
MKGQATFSTGIKIFIGIVAAIIIIFMIVSVATPPKQFSLPPSWRATKIPAPFDSILRTIGVPDQWLWTPGFIYLFVVPLVGILLIVYGFLDAMQIFNVNVNFLLALVIAFATIPFGILTKTVIYMFALMGTYSTGAFTFLFIFGVAYVVINRMTGWFGKTEASTMKKDITYEYLKEYIEDVIENNKKVGNRDVSDFLTKIVIPTFDRATDLHDRGRLTDSFILLRHLSRDCQEFHKRNELLSLPKRSAFL